ncbi:uncharacterized protein LOC116168079 [Photinus pyralis]|uniref:uncharacterized protein LOC116168079 n=1 Tax=Photinus pyralis TaxID=7054 RepID=UPI001266EDE6|nr:uncharacterized protein LOC116168079 [Photinus pyralis]
MKPSTRSNSGTEDTDNAEDTTINFQTLDDKLTTLIHLFNQMAQDVKNMKSKQKEMGASIEACHNKIDDVVVNINSMNGKLKTVEHNYVGLSNENATLKVKIQNLERKMDDLEQYSHRNNLLLYGIPEDPNENVLGVIRRVAQNLNFTEFSTNLLVAAHRLGVKQNPVTSQTQTKRPIIIKFVRRFDKEEFLRLRKVKRNLRSSDLGFADEGMVYINESLTSETRKLLGKTRELAKSKQFQFVWTVDGKIFVRKAAGRPSMRIGSVADLEKL